MPQNTHEFLLELTVEEMPALHQDKLGQDLSQLIFAQMRTAEIADAQILEAVELQYFHTPRRLIISMKNLPLASQPTQQEQKGPRTDAPKQAIQGFLKANDITLKDCLTKPTPTPREPNAKSYFLVKEIPAYPLSEQFPLWVNHAISHLRHPKAMRFYAQSHFRFIRPLRRIFACFAEKPVTGTFAHDGFSLAYEAQTYGHRMLADTPLCPVNLADYQEQMAQNHVIISSKQRISLIQQNAQSIIPKSLHAQPFLPKGLLHELANICEEPCVLLGNFSKKFLDLPIFLIRAVLHNHQKHLTIRDWDEDKLLPHFIFVADGDRGEKNQAVIHGNERVLAARLEDASFFIKQDRNQPIAERQKALTRQTFHHDLGTVAQKVEHVAALAQEICRFTHSNVKQAEHTAYLLKNDLPSLVVGEFPELQGKMAAYYAEKTGEATEITQAIHEHYLPQHDEDDVPTQALSVTLSLADKLINLSGFFAIGQIPTGSKDPFSLRRNAIAIARIIRSNEQFTIPLRLLIAKAFDLWDINTEDEKQTKSGEVLAFIVERQRTYMRNQGFRHDFVDAVFARKTQDDLYPDDLVRLHHDAKTLEEFVTIDKDGIDMMVLWRRISNLIRSEEKKHRTTFAFDTPPEPELFEQSEEHALYDALQKLDFSNHDFAATLHQLAKLRPLVDSFFDHVTVIAQNPKIAQNRMKLLLQFRHIKSQLADFDRIQE